jgi:hypothetical protein
MGIIMPDDVGTPVKDELERRRKVNLSRTIAEVTLLATGVCRNLPEHERSL